MSVRRLLDGSCQLTLVHIAVLDALVLPLYVFVHAYAFECAMHLGQAMDSVTARPYSTYLSLLNCYTASCSKGILHIALLLTVVRDVDSIILQESQ